MALNIRQKEIVETGKKQDDGNNKSDAGQAIKSLTESSIFTDKNINVMSYYERMKCAVEKLQTNEDWRVSMDVNGDGVVEEGEGENLADAIAKSYDSELDLFIHEKVEEAIAKFGCCSKQYLSEDAQKWLKDNYNIVVEAVGAEDQQTNRTYAFSLVDENGNVIQDENGKKGSIIFSDCLIPDGFAQGAEVQLSSILDQLGYECLTKADFIGNEDEYYDMIKNIEEGLKNGEYQSSNGGTETLYGNRKDVTQAIKDLWGGSGSAPGQTGFGGDGSFVGKERAERLEKGEAGKELDKEIEAYKEKRYNELVQQYKDEHGEDPTDAETADMLVQADKDAKQKFASEIAKLG